MRLVVLLVTKTQPKPQTSIDTFYHINAPSVGSAVGCPLYMVKTQLQAQSSGQFSVGFQHSHTGMVNALIKTYHNQGIRGLWRGFEGIVPRTAVGSAIQITTFTMSKDVLSQYQVREIDFNFE